MRIISLLALGLLFVPFVVRAEPLRIGAIYGLSGPLSSFGEEYRNSALLAQEASQPHIRLIFEDSGWDPKRAVGAFQKLSAEGVTVLHVMGAGMSMAIKPLSEKRKMLLYSAAAHPQMLSDASLVIRHSNEASNDAKILAEEIRHRSAKRIASIYVQNEWGEYYNSKLAENLKREGTITFEASPYLPSETDFRDRILSLLAHRPEIFVVNSFGAAAGTIIKQLGQLGFKGVILANNGFVLSRDTLAALGNISNLDLYFQDYPELPPEFCELYFSRYGIKPGYLALAGYTDIELLGAAAATVGPNAEALAKHIRSLKRFRGKYESVDISATGDITVKTLIRKWDEKEYDYRMHPTCRGAAQLVG